MGVSAAYSIHAGDALVSAEIRNIRHIGNARRAAAAGVATA
jgi:hypothetical protein